MCVCVCYTDFLSSRNGGRDANKLCMENFSCKSKKKKKNLIFSRKNLHFSTLEFSFFTPQFTSQKCIALECFFKEQRKIKKS